MKVLVAFNQAAAQIVVPLTSRNTHSHSSNKDMARHLNIFLTLFILLILLLKLTHSTTTFHRNVDDKRREALEIGLGPGIGIGIGIGGGRGNNPSSPPPPPPPSPEPETPPSGPQPCDFPNELLYRAYFVIQKFKQTITCDAQNITCSWNGYDICGTGTYNGFYCATPPRYKDNSTLTVASVDFNSYGLCAPKLTGFVDQLPDLALFHANSNNFSGAVPSLAGLQYFYELDVSNNHLSPSTFPVDVLQQPNLDFLDLRFNNFYGSLPSGVFSMIQPEAIFLNNNEFSGMIPANLGFSKVNYLSLANNLFTGPIPASIEHAGDTLYEVLFLNNKLSGCLPLELGFLKQAEVIDAGTNMLTGMIPASFACLEQLEQLNLASNLLYGEVPDSLCRLGVPFGGQLMNISLSNNYFTSLGPSCWALIKKGILDVRKNCIPWVPDQRSPEECKWFEHRPKKCPVSTIVPCKVKYANKAHAEKAKPDGGQSGGRTSGYKTYSALHEGKKP